MAQEDTGWEHEDNRARGTAPHKQERSLVHGWRIRHTKEELCLNVYFLLGSLVLELYHCFFIPISQTLLRRLFRIFSS